MNDLIRRLQDATRAVGETVENVPPLRVAAAPARPARFGRTWLIPVAAAAAVTVAVGGGALVARHGGRAVDAAAGTPVGPAAAPVFLAQAGGASGGITIRRVADGQVAAVVPRPAPDEAFAAVQAARDNRLFYAATSSGACGSRIYRFTLDGDGQAGAREALSFGPPADTRITSLAVSGDGSTLAYGLSSCARGGTASLVVADTATGESRTWTSKIDAPVRDVSLTEDGRRVLFRRASGVVWWIPQVSPPPQDHVTFTPDAQAPAPSAQSEPNGPGSGARGGEPAPWEEPTAPEEVPAVPEALEPGTSAQGSAPWSSQKEASAVPPRPTETEPPVATPGVPAERETEPPVATPGVPAERETEPPVATPGVPAQPTETEPGDPSAGALVLTASAVPETAPSPDAPEALSASPAPVPEGWGCVAQQVRVRPQPSASTASPGPDPVRVTMVCSGPRDPLLLDTDAGGSLDDARVVRLSAGSGTSGTLIGPATISPDGTRVIAAWGSATVRATEGVTVSATGGVTVRATEGGTVSATGVAGSAFVVDGIAAFDVADGSQAEVLYRAGSGTAMVESIDLDGTGRNVVVSGPTEAGEITESGYRMLYRAADSERHEIPEVVAW